ncbi:MAG TPA: MazG family protein [Actinomycetota bacterium]
MPLLVVPLDPGEVGSLSLAEWDALVACSRVLFERPDHPLAERLRAHGVDAGAFDDEPDAGRDGWAVVVDPTSARVVELAKAGATVTSGVAGSPDALTAAHGAGVARRAAAALGEAALVMARLRSPDGCPWDHEQTHESLEVHLIEEAHEVLDAIDRGATGAELEEELGDLLLQVLFHAQMAADDGRFDIEGVARGLAGKLVHRHPHVFGDVAVSGATDVVRNWETIKAAEKQRTGPFDDVPSSLPALLTAYKIQKRAAGLGWTASPAEAIEGLTKAVAALPAPSPPGVTSPEASSDPSAAPPDATSASASSDPSAPAPSPADATRPAASSDPSASPPGVTSASDTPPGAAPTPATALGEVLFWAVAVARAAGLDPESALRHATLRFKESF